MDERVMMASKFKEQILALLDQVARTRVSILVTKHGRPVARLVPLDDADAGESTDGSVTLLAEDDEAYFATDVGWEADRA